MECTCTKYRVINQTEMSFKRTRKFFIDCLLSHFIRTIAT